MSDAGDELYAVIERIYERMRNYKNVSPIVMAKEAMQAINFGRELHNHQSGPDGATACACHLTSKGDGWFRLA